MIDFDFIYDTIEQPIFILSRHKGAEYKFEKANRAANELIKFGTDEVLFSTPSELGFYDSPEEWDELVDGMQHGESVKTIAKIRTKTQNLLTSELTLTKYINAQEYVVVMQRNVGSHQKVLEALRQSEYRFLRMAESILEGLSIVEAGKMVFVNSAMMNITGYSREELLDMDAESLARKDEKPRLRKFKEKISEKDSGSLSTEYWIITKKGEQKCIQQNITFTQRPDGRKMLYHVVSDVTSRKRTEEALLKSKAEFQMLAENSPDLITRYSHDLIYVYANEAANRTLFQGEGGIFGKTNEDLTIEKEIAAFLEERHLEVFRTGRTLKFEFRLTIRGNIKVFQSSMVPEITNNGKVSSVLNIARDITQIKQVEKNLQNEKNYFISENKLLAKSLNEITDNIRNKCTCEGASLSPFKRIAQWAEYRYTQENFKPTTFVLNPFLQDYFDKQKKKYAALNKVSLVLQVPTYDISVYTDENYLITLFNLLLENALEATPEGVIEIGYDVYNEKELVFFVKDTGCGMEPEETDRIFEPFTAFHKENHVGLGLSIADKLVEALDGQIWCLSSPGTGSTFCFTLPAEIEKSILKQKKDKSRSNDDWSNKRILVVEDNDNNYFLLETIFKRFKPHIDRFVYGEQAVEAVRNNEPYDIILMDIQLPDINGYEVTQKIRTFNQQVPIIAQTAFAMYDNVVKALESGCNDFVAKPIKPKKLVAMMNQYFES